MKPQLFLDCDGVLADFDSLATTIFEEHPRSAEARIGSDAFWDRLVAHGSFYRDLPVLAQGRILFEAVRHLNPVLLTGCPPGDWAAPQKVEWAAAHFPGTRIITCLSKDKRMHMQPGDILVDDYLKYRHLWLEAGGIFVHYINAAQATDELTALGLPMKPTAAHSS